MRGSSIKKQKGAALILFFTTIVIAATTIVLSAFNNRSPEVQDRINKQIEMAKIKEQLLGYALNFADYNASDDGPGRLPCPDTNNDGAANCSPLRTLGRLPESLVTPSSGPIYLSDRYAGVDQQFWYAVAPRFRSNSATLNSTDNVPANLLSLDGATAEYAALIIAPGAALDSQSRSAGVQFASYLESASSFTATTFTTEDATDSSLFNDSIIGITGDEVMTFATLRAMLEFKRLMLARLPFIANTLPANLTVFQTLLVTLGASNWFVSDDWMGAIDSYTAVSATVADLKFQNCNIVYTIDFVADTVTRAPLSC